MNLNDPAYVKELADALRLVLGPDDVREAVRKVQERDPTAPPHEVFRGFALVESWLSAMAQGTVPPQVDLMLRFCAIASVVRSARELPSAQPWLDDLRKKAFQADPDLFAEALFEAEFANYWINQVAHQPNTADFGPPSGHPDVWVAISLCPPKRLPVECKRIRPHGQKERQLEALANELDHGLQSLITKSLPMKVIVWLHRAPKPQDGRAMLGMIAEIAGVFGQERGWQTRFSADGDFQVSAAPLAADGEFQDSISITDVDAEPILIPRIEMVRTQDGCRVRTRSLLSLRSDLARDRLGNLRKNLRTAVRQLHAVDGGATQGIAALRIRPPRDKGDLYHTDREIRALLVREAADHVALVAVFWNEEEQQEEPFEVEGAPAKRVTAGYHLKPYFVVNPHCSLQFGWDSYAQYFGDLDAPVVRDPKDGSLKPVDAETMAVLRDGGELPPWLNGSVKNLEDLTPPAHSATVCVEFAAPIAQAPAGLLSLLRVGDRQFRTFIEPPMLLRTIEVRDAMPVAVCTVDLRAWSQDSRLCWFLDTTEESFRIGIRSPDDSQQLWAAAARVPQLDETDEEAQVRARAL